MVKEFTGYLVLCTFVATCTLGSTFLLLLFGPKP